MASATATVSAAPAQAVPQIVARDPAGHGLLCHLDGKSILLMQGTPEQMGAAQGALLKEHVQKLVRRALYLVGSVDSVRGDTWFFDRMAEIERRTTPHIPARFFQEMDAIAKSAGLSQRDGRYSNLFPERFHCSGVAVCGSASKDGHVYHARVLDYMSFVNLQESAAIQVYMPEGFHSWISVGYAGFVGTVTAMNDQGLAVGEMGGRGEGDWDGMPMSLLLRDIMERANNVDEAIDILKKTPRTCEYYYIFSDKSRKIAGIHATAKVVEVLHPGEQNPQLPFVPKDTVFISADERACALSDRLKKNLGQIDAAKLIEIIKRPVASQNNLHNAVFAPEDLELWFADAGKNTPACDEKYVRCNLRQLVQFYKTAQQPAGKAE
ncbi:MAG TPA: C45 family peptidase [Pirellulales bacterium]|nr:C45 family peptidase [Pirellulales bacterium]